MPIAKKALGRGTVIGVSALRMLRFTGLGRCHKHHI